MRLFSIMGAYSLIANNELIHLGMFVVVCLIKMDKKAGNQDDKECYNSIDQTHQNLKIVHIICAILLFLPRLFDFTKRYKEKSIHLKKITKAPIIFESLPLISLAIYIAILFECSSTFFDCSSLYSKSLLLNWIVIE